MKYLITFFLCLASIVHMHAQSLSLFDVDASNFPTMKAKFYAFDAGGKQVRPNATDLKISENGIQRTISGVTCPPPAPPIAISSILTIDVSGSMSGGSYESPNIDLAKAAVKAWIQSLPAGLSECALTSFDNSNYLNQDFTTDRSKLLKAITTLSPNGGTNYDMGLLEPLAGSLQVSKRGHFKRVVIFLSDGMPSSEPKTTAIIAEAKRQSCMVFAVTLGMACPQSLKDISTQTGGLWYENVTTTQDAENIYRRIMQVVLNITPCEITWTGDVSCEAGNTSVQLQWQSQSATASFTPPPSAISSLNVSPNFIAFGKQLPSTQHDTTFTFTAQNADFTVTGISRKFGSAEFTVVNTSFPFIIPKNTSKNITLRFAPSDSGLKYASFEIATDKCSAYFSTNGGFTGKKSAASTLKLTKPNGGESFVIGSDTVITWEGIAPSDTVSLEYSSDNGLTWKLLTTEATGLKYTWKNIPRPTSTMCLVRVKQVYISDDVLTLTRHGGSIIDIAFSPDGSRIATASDDHTAKVWDAYNGNLILTLTGHSNAVHGIAFSPDGSLIATASKDSTAKVWDAYTGVLIRTLTGHTNIINCITFSSDGSKIATASWDVTAKIWDSNNGELIRTLGGYGGYSYGIAFSPDGKSIAITCGFIATVWNVDNGFLRWNLAKQSDYVAGIAYSPDGNWIATSSYDQTAKIWDAQTGTLVRTLIGHSRTVWDITFSRDGSRIVTASFDNTVKVWDAFTGKLLRTLTINNLPAYGKGFHGVAISPDGSRIAAANWVYGRVWDINTVRSLIFF